MILQRARSVKKIKACLKLLLGLKKTKHHSHLREPLQLYDVTRAWVHVNCRYIYNASFKACLRIIELQ